MGVSN